MRSKQVPTTGSVPHPAVLCTVLEGMVFQTINGEWILSQQTNSTQRARKLESLVNGRDKINEAFPKGHPTLLSTEHH